MADPHSPRPLTVVVAAWLTMVWSCFTAIGAFLSIVALLLLQEGLAGVPFLEPLADRALGGFVAALAACFMGLWLGSLVWRRSRPARWLLLALASPLVLVCLYVGGRVGAFFGVPLGLTVLGLVAPPTGRWLTGTSAGGDRRRAIPEARPAVAGVGCVAAALAHLIGVVVLGRALVTLAVADLGDHELAELVNPADAQTWGLALLLVLVAIHLGLGLAALVALGRSAGARVVVSVGAGTGALVHGGAWLQTFDALLAVMTLLFLTALVLLATPAANAWFRAPGDSLTPGGPDAPEVPATGADPVGVAE